MTIHATTVSIGGLAVVITGKSGSGKSSLALQLLALGARLIADDQTQIEAFGNGIWASRPTTLPSKIEARGIGLLNADMAETGKVALVVDLDDTETERLPPPKTTEIHGEKITIWRKVPAPHFPAAIFVYLSNLSDAKE